VFTVLQSSADCDLLDLTARQPSEERATTDGTVPTRATLRIIPTPERRLLLRESLAAAVAAAAAAAERRGNNTGGNEAAAPAEAPGAQAATGDASAGGTVSAADPAGVDGRQACRQTAIFKSACCPTSTAWRTAHQMLTRPAQIDSTVSYYGFAQHACPCPTQEPAQQLHGQQELSAALQEARDVTEQPGAGADVRPGQGAERIGEANGAAVSHPDAQSRPQQQLSSRSNVAQVCLPSRVLMERQHAPQTEGSRHTGGAVIEQRAGCPLQARHDKPQPSRSMPLLILGLHMQGVGRDGARHAVDSAADDDDGAKAAAQQLETGPLAAVDCSVCMCRPVQVWGTCALPFGSQLSFVCCLPGWHSVQWDSATTV